ncbi:MAG: hypothetical protein IPP74_14600 [Alphaproteobacteria bacterium]|nr:hypothetical protein [Alphaproteobacteria bacterium]
MPQNEQDEFLKDLEPQTSDPFEQPTTPSVTVDEPEKESDEEKSNRRERRLQAKLQAERESSIALAARLEALTEAQKFSRETNPDVDDTISRIYGTDTPEAVAATTLLQKALANAEDRATERAIAKIREEQQQERASVQQEERTLEGMIESIEDETGLTLDAQTQKGFFTLLEKLSPKDSDGNVVAYADHHAVWDEYQARKTPVSSRAKDLSSRSMVKTGTSPSTSVETDATERYLRENGLI